MGSLLIDEVEVCLKVGRGGNPKKYVKVDPQTNAHWQVVAEVLLGFSGAEVILGEKIRAK